MVAMDFDLSRDQLEAMMLYQAGSLKEQKAARKAQDSYNKKRLELERQGLALQADQIAKQYAMDQAKLEWDKESFRLQFGEEQFQNKWEREFQDRQQALDETWRTAEQTGFRDGVPTLAKMQFDEQTRQFNVGQANNERDFGESVRRYDQDFSEQQRQFNTNAVLNAPRGPADWAAYQNRLRGLQNAGSLMFSDAPVASFSNGGQQTGPVLSNTDLALAMTGQGDPSKLQDTAWHGMAPQQQQTYSAMGQPDAQQPSSFKTNSSNPYGDGQPASSNAAANALGVGQQQQSATQSPYGSNQSQSQSQSALSIPSLQRFRKFNPTEQAMGLGELEEAGVATADDAKWMMERQAPQYARSRGARMTGV